MQAEATIKKRQRGIGKTAIEKYRVRFDDDWIETKEVEEETHYVLKTLEEYRPATVIFEGEGRTFRLGQNMSPRSDLPYYDVVNYLLQIDYVAAKQIFRQELWLCAFPNHR